MDPTAHPSSLAMTVSSTQSKGSKNWQSTSTEAGTKAEAPSRGTSASKESAETAPAETPPLESQIESAIEQLTTGDFHSRWDSAKQFSRQFSYWGDRIIPPLIRALHSQQDPDTQWFLVRILSQFEHPDIVTALAQLLVGTPSEDLQIEVSKALSALGESAIATLTTLLNEPATAQLPRTEDATTEGSTAKYSTEQPLTDQRILAARTLAHIRRSATIEPLLSITTDANPELRVIAIEALGSFHDPRITAVLLAALQDEPAICIEAIRTLGRRRDLLATTDLIGPLQQCLLSGREAVACESAIALGRLGTEKAITAMGEPILEPLSTAVKTAIVQALGWLNEESAVTYLTRAFEAPMPIIMPTVKKAIANALGQTRTPTLQKIAATPLINWLSTHQASEQTATSPNSTPPNSTPALETFALTQTILSALARLGATDALESLIPMLSHPDPRIRMHALNALKQIAPRTAQARAQRYLHHPELSPIKKQYVSETLAAW